MKFSTRSRYALRAMVDLAKQSSENPVSLAVLADNQGLPLKYLENLFFFLRHANLVCAVRGPYGGYRLTRDPESISVLDIVQAVEGTVELVECIGRDETFCPRLNDCPTRPLWTDLSRLLSRRMAEISLRDLALGINISESGHE
mgnify:CR=1 FL=1